MSSPFLNAFVFPTAISRGARGGPRWAGEITVTDSGYEDRNQPWSYPLHDYDVGWGVKETSDLELIIAAFNEARGRLYGFRYQDPLDWKSCAREADIANDDQVLIDSAVGGETTVQLTKTYDYSGSGFGMSRKITRPFGTVLLAKNTTPLVETTDYTIDLTTGLVTLTAALIAGDQITAGFHFHVPVRFDTNRLPITLQQINAGSASIPLTEVRE